MRNKRKDAVAVVATEEGRQDKLVFETRARGKGEAQLDFSSTIEISDADYRSLHLPCDALEESPRHVEKINRKPGD